MERPPSGRSSKTAQIHVGFDLFAAVTKRAIDVSAQLGVQITTSKFSQYVLENFSERAAQQYVSEQRADSLDQAQLNQGTDAMPIPAVSSKA